MRTQKNLFALFFVFLLLSCLLVAHADMGPKDQLTVRLVNPPQEPYYLDLLWQPQLQDGPAALRQPERGGTDRAGRGAAGPSRRRGAGGLGARVQRAAPARLCGAISRAGRTGTRGCMCSAMWACRGYAASCW